MSAVIKDNAHGKTLVSLRGLNKHYGDFTAVDNLDLEIQEGEFLTFLGSSGSASPPPCRCWPVSKRRAAARFWSTASRWSTCRRTKRDIGMVFQRYSLFPHLNVRDNIAFRWPFANSMRAKPASASMPCSSWCNWNSSPNASRRRCPAASSNVWRLPARWCTSHAFC